VRARGIALLMGLVLLAAISLLAVMAANGMLLQRRMAANFGAGGRALAQATRAVEAARSWLNSRADFERTAGCLDDCVLPAAIYGLGQLPRNPEFESAAWWGDHAVATGYHPESRERLPGGGEETNSSSWIIEELRYEPVPEGTTTAAVSGVGYYRVLARGTGSGDETLAITESIIARPWEGEYEPAPFPPNEPSGAFCRQFDPAIACGTLAWRQRR